MTALKKAGFFVYLALFYGCAAALRCANPSPESLLNGLKTELFPKKLLRPVKNFSDTLNVTVDMTVVGILGVNEKAQTLTIFIWQVLVQTDHLDNGFDQRVTQKWYIHGLNWDEKECGGKRISVPRKNLWIPDVLITEFMDEDTSPKAPYVYINNTGIVYDDRPIRVTSACRLVIYTFPFDIQNCSLTFEPYLHFATDIRLIPGTTAAQILKESKQVIQTKGEWELVDIGIAPTTLEINEGRYSEVKYFIILRRRPVLYVVNLIIPSCFLLTLDLFSFLLPLQSVDRSAFKMTLILGYTVFLLIMNDLLPVTGNETPLLNVSFLISLALMVSSLLETVLITNIQFSCDQYKAAPRWLSVLMLKYLAVIVCLPPKTKSNRVTVSLPSVKNPGILSTRDLQSIFDDSLLEKHHPEPSLVELRKLSKDLTAIRLQMDSHFKENKSSEEWQMIGMVIDRLLFGLYIVFLSVTFVTVMIVWLLSYRYPY